jgi:hypothetical protein
MSKVAISKPESRSTVMSRKPTIPEGNPLSGLTWKLPSGESLAEFALRFGFLAPRLLGSKVSRYKGLSHLREVR